jgi:hypothetical protein
MIFRAEIAPVKRSHNRFCRQIATGWITTFALVVEAAQLDAADDGTTEPNNRCLCCSARVRKCAGLRTPATATLPHAPTAGVGNWPRDEIAEGGAPRVRLVLWGFERGRRDDGGGSAP